MSYNEELEKLKDRLRKENTPEEKSKRLIYTLENMKQFKCIDNIPSVPITDSETYKKYVIPNYIRCGAIPKEKLIVGKTYIGECRNASEAKWDGKKFTYMRTKFGFVYPEDINHFEDDDGYDLFVPLKEKEETTD